MVTNCLGSDVEESEDQTGGDSFHPCQILYDLNRERLHPLTLTLSMQEG